MGKVIDMLQWKRKKALEEQEKKRRFYNPFASKPAKSTAQKIKEALAKYGSHRKNENNKNKD